MLRRILRRRRTGPRRVVSMHAKCRRVFTFLIQKNKSEHNRGKSRTDVTTWWMMSTVQHLIYATSRMLFTQRRKAEQYRDAIDTADPTRQERDDECPPRPSRVDDSDARVV